jgi:dipeptidyl aminopeptidase/acylaminoacyl peptidase
MHTTFTTLLGQLLVGTALLFTLIADAGAADKLPIEHFTRTPAFDDVSISPAGNRLAMVVLQADGRRRVGVMELDPIGEVRIVGGFSDADVEQIEWVGNDRLIFSAREPRYELRAGRGGVFAVDHDGSAPRQLIAGVFSIDNAPGSNVVTRVLNYEWFVHSTTDDDSGEIFVQRVVFDGGGDVKQFQLARLNTRTGALRSLSQGMPEGTRSWHLDAKREPRMLTASVKGRTKIYWRAKDRKDWTEVADFDPLKDPSFWPVLVSATADTEGLYKFDPVTKRLDPEPVVSVKGFDLMPSRVVDSATGRLMGVHFMADRPMSYWFDDKLEQVQRGIDAALPAGRFNRLYCGRCESTRLFVVRSMSDRQPGEFFLFDRQKGALSRIGAMRPWIDEATQGRRSFHRITARDGLTIPVIVTHPAGAAANAALPAVVRVHGGPWVRGGSLAWSAEAQFLASRGYRVIEPEFRGSHGFGERHFKAGWKQWGQAMQDDLADAVRWAADQKLIDPARVCVTGASYGGYAALMAPITHPATFKCAASFAGVTDIDLMYTISWSDFSEEYRRHGMPELIGDRMKDAEMLARASPLKRVAEIKVPLLVGHGAADRRVPIEHSKQFVAAAQRAGVFVEPVYYNGEGHGFVQPANEADYFGKLERFFERALKAPR